MEKRYRVLTVCVACLLFCLFPSAAAWANSSWVWAAKTRPYDVLPYVIVLTLGIETAALVWLAKIPRIAKVFCLVALANLLSFLAPYAIAWLRYRMDPPNIRIYPSFLEELEHGPVYTVGLVYALVTLVVELPLLYARLKKDAGDRKRLLWVLVGANLLTTALTYGIEILFCPGSW